MTPAQTRHYWRSWSKALKALQWRPDIRFTEMATRVIATAGKLCGREGAMTPDALRHACHLVALGRPRSSKQLSNAELDRVLLVFKLIVDGDDLAAMIAIDDPDQGTVKRLTWAIRRAAPEALTVKLCRDKFGRADWENLDAAQLRQLLMTLKRIGDRQDERQAHAAGLA